MQVFIYKSILAGGFIIVNAPCVLFAMLLCNSMLLYCVSSGKTHPEFVCIFSQDLYESYRTQLKLILTKLKLKYVEAVLQVIRWPGGC